ncbi:MAG: T9SS type A sorting domain-containing protein [Flavobacteriales bacterium]|nr:T9SS type A sorting domain-containing protein [Flavobacteriales bacterium]
MKKILLILASTIFLQGISISQTQVANSEISFSSNGFLNDNITSPCSSTTWGEPCASGALNLYQNGTSTINVDLAKVRKINSISTYATWGSASFCLTVKISVASSTLGPWQTLNQTCYSCPGTVYVPNVYSLNTNIDKSFRYVKIDFWTNINNSFSNYWISIPEVRFFESPNITSSLSSPLSNGQCTTLTAAAGGETYLWSPGGQTTQSITVCNSGTYNCQVTNTSFTGNQDHTASIAVSTLGTQDNWVGPNGEVYSIHRSGNTVYYGGDFNAVGPITGSGAQIDETSGAANTALPRVYGTVNVTIPDGSGGWYIGGVFSRVGNYTNVSNLAHIKSDGTVDTGFKPIPNGAVNTLALYGSNLYVGGAFTTIQGLANNYLAKIDKSTGTPIFWNANCNNTVRTMQLYADQIIVGGNFTSIGGATRNYLGAVDTTYVQATTWNPNPNAAVYKVFVNGTKLYVGGDFTTISAVSKSRGAGYTLPGFTIDGYDFGANNRIHDFAFNNNVLYAAGTFTVIGGASRNYLAGLNYLNMLANGFNATADGIVQTVAIWNGNLIVGGDFSNIGGAARSRLASLNVSTGVANAWNPNVVGLKGTTYNVLALATNGTNIYAGGTFWSVGASTRNNIAAVDATTGALLSFDANANNIVRSVYSDGTNVYMGGDFTTVNGTITKNRIAQVNGTTGVATGWNPNADGSVNALAVSGTNLFVGGAFANIGGAARAKMAALTISTGGATAFNPTANGNVNALAVSGDTLFIGGAFTTIGGQTRNRVALYKISTSGILGTDPNANNTVNALAIKGDKLYIGGSFTTVGTTTINSLAEYNVTTNAITTLNSGIASSTGVNALATADSSLYSVGGFSYANNGQAINNGATIKTLSNRLGYWMPQPDDIVRAIYLGSDKAYVGGRFKVIQSRYQPFFATTDLYNPGNPPTVTSVSPTTACVNGTITITGTGFSNITAVKVGTTSVPFTLVSSTSITITPTTAVSGVITVSNVLGNAVSTQSVAVNATPTATITSGGTTTFCQGSSVVLNANTGTGLTYQWKNNGTNITGATAASYTASAAGSYTVVVTNSNSCSATSSATTVTVNPLTTPTFTQVAAICSGGTLSALPTTSNNSIAGSWSPALNNTATTTYTFTPTSTASPTCATTTTMTITVNPLPTATITAGGATTFCQESSVMLNANTGTGLTYQWKNNGTNITGATTASYTANASGSYTVVVTNSNSCSKTSSATTVTVNPLTTPTFTQVAAICSGGTLSALPTTSNNSIAGTWSPALNNTATTTYTFTPTSTASPTCATTTTMTITVNPLTTPAFTQIAAICSGGTLSALSTTSNNSIAGTWSPALNNTATTTYTFTPTSTASPTCATTTTMTITVNALPTSTITAGGATTFCQGGSVVLNANTGTGLTYQWKNNGTNITGATAASYTATSAGSYTVVVTNSNSCSATSSATTVTVNPLTTPTFTQVAAICSGGTLSALPTTSNNSIAGSWSPALNNTATTTYTFTPTSTASPTCATTTTMTITVNPLPTATITAGGASTFCQGGSVVLNANTGTGLTYQWKNNGTNITGATAASYTASPAGSYTVVVTNSNSCTATSTATSVTVNPLTTPTFTQVAAICSGGTLSALPTTSNNSIAGSWSPALNNTATTTYTFTPTSTASPTCATTTTMTITVNALPTSTITAGGATTFCQGGSVVLNANTGTGLTYQWKNNGTNITGATAASYTATAAGSYTVVVTNSNSCSATSSATTVTVNPLTTPTFTQVAAICSGGTLSALPTTSNNSIAGTWSPALNNTATTTYTFTPTSTASPTCATTTTMTITVNALPTSTITAGGATSFCQGDSVVLSVVSDNGTNYQWLENGVNLNNANSSNYTANTSGSYTVLVMNSNGCSTTSTATTVTVNPLTTPTFTQVAAICSGGTLSALPTTSNNSIAGTWSPALNNTATTTYTFTPTSTASPTCATNATMAITVNPLPIVSLNSFNQVCDTLGVFQLTGGLPIGGVYSGTSVTNNVFNTSIGVGVYPISYSYTDNNGCSSSANQSLTVIDCSGVGIEVNKLDEVYVYPNPAVQYLVVKSSNSFIGKTFLINDLSGRNLLKESINESEMIIDISRFSRGTYFIYLPESQKTFKWIKQ